MNKVPLSDEPGLKTLLAFLKRYVWLIVGLTALTTSLAIVGNLNRYNNQEFQASVSVQYYPIRLPANLVVPSQEIQTVVSRVALEDEVQTRLRERLKQQGISSDTAQLSTKQVTSTWATLVVVGRDAAQVDVIASEWADVLAEILTQSNLIGNQIDQLELYHSEAEVRLAEKEDAVQQAIENDGLAEAQAELLRLQTLYANQLNNVGAISTQSTSDVLSTKVQFEDQIKLVRALESDYTALVESRAAARASFEEIDYLLSVINSNEDTFKSVRIYDFKASTQSYSGRREVLLDAALTGLIGFLVAVYLAFYLASRKTAKQKAR